MAPKPKLTTSQIETIRALKKQDPAPSNQELADRYGVGRTTIEKALLTQDAPASGATDILELPLDLLAPDPLNPRRHFVEADIRELANSIEQNGLLQNLVVRQPKDDGYMTVQDAAGGTHAGLYFIVAGERRWRALTLLAQEGRWDNPVPCWIKNLTDTQMLALALVENLQRENLSPLEEADGIARLHAADPAEWSTAAIATAISRSQRYVQQRIAISTNLAAAAKLLLAGKHITLECARELAGESEAVQLELLSEYEMDEFNDSVPASEIEPDLNAYLLEDIENLRLRREQQKRLAASLAAPQPQAAMRLDSPIRASAREAGNDAEDATDDPEPAAQIERRIEAENPNKQSQPVTKAHIYHAHRAKSQAMQIAVAKDPEMAMRLICLALLAPQNVVMIRKTNYYDGIIVEDKPEYVQFITSFISKTLGSAKPPEYLGEEKATAKFWKRLTELQDGDLQNFFAATVSGCIITPAGPHALLGDNPLAEAVATTLKIPGNEAQHELRIEDAEDLDGLSKAVLLAVAEASQTPGVTKTMKVSDLKEAILNKRKNLNYVLPTFRFGSTKKLETLLEKATQ